MNMKRRFIRNRRNRRNIRDRQGEQNRDNKLNSINAKDSRERENRENVGVERTDGQKEQKTWNGGYRSNISIRENIEIKGK